MLARVAFDVVFASAFLAALLLVRWRGRAPQLRAAIAVTAAAYAVTLAVVATAVLR